MVGMACLGATIAGIYGIIHDQVTFSISPEYFTRLKFDQFRWADVGLPVRVFVSEIGFFATWWVGLIAGWVFARITIRDAGPRERIRLALRGFTIVVGFALIAATVAFAYGLWLQPQPATSGLAARAFMIGVSDVSAFARVGYIHNAGYLGGSIGIVIAAVLLRRKIISDQFRASIHRGMADIAEGRFRVRQPEK